MRSRTRVILVAAAVGLGGWIVRAPRLGAVVVHSAPQGGVLERAVGGAEAQHPVLRVYDLRAVLAIRTFCGPAEGRGDADDRQEAGRLIGVGSWRLWQGRALVRATPAEHAEIERVMAIARQIHQLNTMGPAPP